MVEESGNVLPLLYTESCWVHSQWREKWRNQESESKKKKKESGSAEDKKVFNNNKKNFWQNMVV